MNGNYFGGCLAAVVLAGLAAASAAEAQSANLSITKTLTDPAAPLGINPGDQIVYTIQVNNAGPNSASTVSVADTTPSGLQFVSNTGDCTNAFPCALGTMTSGQSKTITATYLVPANYAPSNAVVNLATVSSATSDPNTGNNSSLTTSPVNGVNCGNFSVSGGTAHTCAIVAGNGKAPPNDLPDDVLECWGNNFSDQSAPVPAGAVEQVSAGAFHTCALRENGTIECWGDDSSDQVSTTPTDTDFVQVDAGFNHTCALRADFSIECWGDDTFGQSSAPAGLFTQVAAGNVHSCGLHTDRTIECWGFDGDDDESGDPIVTGGPTDDDFVQVVAGGEHVCGRHDDGTVDCWGSDFSGEAADPSGTWISISAGDEHNCGLRSGNTVECWGDNSTGQLDEPGDALTSLDSGAYHTCGLISDGGVICWGDDSERQSSPPGRSELCPICGDGTLEARETCEACQGLGDPPCSPLANFAACCSPVTCTAYRLSENHVCRNATGACDAPEVCDGINFSACPAPGPLRPSTFVCRAALGSCDPQETCTGSTNTCPANQPFLPSTTTCRAVAGSCDILEKCTGTSAACPNDVVVAASTPCRAVAGVCDLQEQCTGSDAECPADVFKTSAVTCRSASGVCDVAEVCSGGATCPDNVFAGLERTCRASTTLCDAQELCSGTSTACPDDVIATSITPCRASTGGCDVVERCTGTSTVCPNDQIASTGTVCRSPSSVCDAAEMCAGTGKACPADAFSASTVVCRAAVDVCDVAERCTGGSNACPANSFAATTTACNDGAFCNGADTCNGSGACTGHAGNPCPGPDGDANCTESCNESSDACNSLDANGSPCDDGNACTSGETCTAGNCSGGTVTECDDGDVCTFDTCTNEDGCVHLPGVEESNCLEATKGQIFLRNSSDPSEMQFKWAWKKGEAFGAPILGNPLDDTQYTLCVYDRNAGESTLVASLVVPPSAEFWRQKDARVSYKNKGFTVDGIYSMKAKGSDTPGKSSAHMKGAGGSMNLPDPVASNLYFFRSPSLVAQLRTDEGLCLTTEFLPIDFRKNWDNTVKAQFDR